MRVLCLATTLLVFAGCSCGRQADVPAVTDTTAPDSAAGVAPALTQEAATTAVAAQAQAKQAAAAVSSLHAYIGAVAAKDWPRADAYWSGGKPSPRPDDQVLRALEDLRSMRINNEAPKPLDEESPPRALEIPVSLRVGHVDGNRQIKGWYRMRKKVDGSGWEITTASLQPVFD